MTATGLYYLTVTAFNAVMNAGSASTLQVMDCPLIVKLIICDGAGAAVLIAGAAFGLIALVAFGAFGAGAIALGKKISFGFSAFGAGSLKLL